MFVQIKQIHGKNGRSWISISNDNKLKERTLQLVEATYQLVSLFT